MENDAAQTETQTTLPLSEEAGRSDIEFESQILAKSLVEQGLIAPEFYESGALDEFDINTERGISSLAHILVGDEMGGAHHIPTLFKLWRDGYTVASTYADPSKPDKRPGEFRREQKVRANGAFRALHVVIPDDEGTLIPKDGGSSMFPNEWTTQEVLESILAVAVTEGQPSADPGMILHLAQVKDVVIKVFTSATSGKILTGFPK